MRRALAALACTVLLAGCGGSSDADGIEDAFNGYVEAVKQKDGDKLCDSIASPELVKLSKDRRAKEIEDCRDDFSADEFDNAPELEDAEVKDVAVKGDQATAKVTVTVSGKKETSEVRFVKVDGEWKLRFDSR